MTKPMIPTLGRKLVIALIVVTLVTGGIGSVVAQSVPDSGTPTPTPTPQQPTDGTTTNSGDDGSDEKPWLIEFANNTTDAAADFGSDFINDPMGTVKESIDAAHDFADKQYRQSMGAILGPAITAIVEVPTFGLGLLDDQPGIHKPTRWPFNVLWPVYIGIQALTGLVLMIVIASGFLRLSVPTQNTYRATLLTFRGIKALFVGVVFHLLIIAILHTAVNEIALAIAPRPSELAGDLLKVMTTSALTWFFGSVGGNIIRKLIKMWLFIWTYLAFFPIISGPFFAVWQYNGNTMKGKVSGTILYTYFGLLFSKILVALILRISWVLDWGQGPFGPLNILISIGLFWIAFFIPPAMLIFILFSRYRAMRGGAYRQRGRASRAVSHMSSKLYKGGKKVKGAIQSDDDEDDTVEDRTDSKGRGKHTRTKNTSTSTKERVGSIMGGAVGGRVLGSTVGGPVGAAAGGMIGSRVGGKSREQESTDNTFGDWKSSDGTENNNQPSNGGTTQTDDTVNNPQSGTAENESTTSTRTVAQQVRDIERRGRNRGNISPGERRQYQQYKDEQKYSQQIEDQQKSTVRRNAEQRYRQKSSDHQ